SVFAQGTPFLSQLHDDLGALLDANLTAQGDDPSITAQLIDQVLSRFSPALGAAGARPVQVVALWLDPVSLDTVDPAVDHLKYDLGTGQLTNDISNSFVSVTGNIEVVVLVVDIGDTGTFTLSLGDVPADARGGVVLLGSSGDQTIALTDSIRSGTTSFS